jgi:glycosyltransferase involved in cell wall biosynthesis
MVIWPGSDPAEPRIPSGLFVPNEYTWHLPVPAPRNIIFLGSPENVTARMLAVALVSKVRTIGFWNVGGWDRRSVVSFAIAKVFAKLARRIRAVADRASPPSSKLFSSRKRRVIQQLLSRESICPKQSASRTTNLPRRGIVFACPTLVAGGAERQLVNTAVALQSRGAGPITVLVARLANPAGNDFFLPMLHAAKIDAREVRHASELERWVDVIERASHPNGRTILKLLNALPADIAHDIADLRFEISQLHPQVVHCWLDYSNVRAGLAAACCGVPRIILSGRNVGPQHFPNFYERFMYPAYQALIEQPGVLLVNNSQRGAQDYAAWLGITEDRIRVVYNGLDRNSFTRPTDSDIKRFRTACGLDPHVPVVGGLFRFSKEKRPLLWLKVADIISHQEPAVSFLLFGSGQLRRQMQAFVDERELAGRVRLLAPTPQSTLALSAFDLMLLTSEWEGTPNVAIEAQAVGTPVVLTGGGGAAEAVLDRKTGLFVRQPDAEKIAEAVITLLRDGPRRERLSAAGPSFAKKRFGLKRMVDETLDLYNQSAK